MNQRNQIKQNTKLTNTCFTCNASNAIKTVTGVASYVSSQIVANHMNVRIVQNSF